MTIHCGNDAINGRITMRFVRDSSDLNAGDTTAIPGVEPQS
jgi:hypothetical protein